MAELATLLSNAFQLPTRQQQQVPRGAQQQGQQGIGSPMEGIQAVDGLTQDYYTKWGDLESFAQEMNSYGIDVTRPDWRSKEAMEAHGIYQKAMADLQYQGQKLKNSQQMLQKFASAKLSAQGQDIKYRGDVTGAPFDISRVEHAGIPSREREAGVAERAQAQIDVRRSEGVLNRNLQREIAALRDRKQQTELKERIAPYKGIYSDALNIAAGDAKWGQSTELSEGGVPMLSAPFWEGKRLGSYEQVKYDKSGQETVKTLPRIVAGALRDAETGEVYIQFEHGARQKVDQNSINNLVASYAESNRGYKAQDAQEFLGMIEQPEAIEQAPIEEAALSTATSTAQRLKEDSATFDSLVRWGTGMDLEVDGTKVNVHREARSWTGVGKSDLKVENAEVLGLDSDTRYTGEEIARALHRAGYYRQTTPDTTIEDTAQVMETTQEALDPEARYNVGGREYSLHALMGLDPRYTEEVIMKKIQSGKINVVK